MAAFTACSGSASSFKSSPTFSVNTSLADASISVVSMNVSNTIDHVCTRGDCAVCGIIAAGPSVCTAVLDALDGLDTVCQNLSCQACGMCAVNGPSAHFMDTAPCTDPDCYECPSPFKAGPVGLPSPSGPMDGFSSPCSSPTCGVCPGRDSGKACMPSFSGSLAADRATSLSSVPSSTESLDSPTTFGIKLNNALARSVLQINADACHLAAPGLASPSPDAEEQADAEAEAAFNATFAAREAEIAASVRRQEGLVAQIMGGDSLPKGSRIPVRVGSKK